MSIVPTFQQEDLPQIMQTGPQADVAAAGYSGEAIARLGEAGNAALSKIIDQENYDYTASNIAAARTKWTDEYIKRSDAAQQSSNYNGFTQQLTSDMGTDLQQRIDNAPTPRAADALKKTFANLQDEFLTKSASFEHDGHRSVETANITTNLDHLGPVAYRDPSQAEAVYGEGIGIIHGGAAAGLNQGDLAKMSDAWANRVYGGVVQNGIENNPQATSAALRAGHYDAYLSEPQLVSFQRQADDEVARQQAEAQRQARENALMMRGSVEDAVRDNLASIADTGKPAVALSHGQIAAAYPNDPERVNAIVASLGRAQTGYVATQHVALNGPDDDTKLLADMTPKGSGYADQAATYNSVLGAIQQKNKALASDPAAYVQQNAPQVRTAFAAAAQNPALLPKAVAAQDAVLDHLGVPEDQRPVLPRTQAMGIVRGLAGADPAKGDAGAALDSLSKTYGDAWPRVYADLVRAKLPAGYEALATMDTPDQAAGRQDMQRALAVAAQKGGAKELEGDAPPEASSAIKTGLPDELAAFRQTAVIPGAASNVDMLTKVGNAVSTLAHYYAIQGQDGSTALKSAYDAVIGDKYDFDGTMRVPKGMLPAVHAATDQALASLKPEDLRASAGLPSDIASDRWASAQQNSAWYPTEHDDGLMLMVRSRDGRMSRVLRADGSPVQVKFDAVKKASEAPIGGLPPTQAPASPAAGTPPAAVSPPGGQEPAWQPGAEQ